MKHIYHIVLYLFGLFTFYKLYGLTGRKEAHNYKPDETLTIV